jgi:hypothetical protein
MYLSPLPLEMVKLDYSGVKRIRLWSCLEEEEPPIEPLELGSTANTEPTHDKVHIPRELVDEWADSDTDPFPDYEGIKAYAQADDTWKALDTHIGNEDYPRIATTHPWRTNSETILEMMLKTHFDVVNLALEKTQVNERHIMIAGGKSATAGNSEAGISSEPDRASFTAPTRIFQSGEDPQESLLIYCFSNLNNKGAKERQNIIPGEIKVWYKFRRDFLDATEIKDGVVVPDYSKRAQAEQVLTQIYQYLNERHSAIGYLITDQELICIRRLRKERFGIRYGVLDISPSIPLSVKRGKLNAKLALWYLHHKYAVKEPQLSEFSKTPKPRKWADMVAGILAARNTASRARYGLRERVNRFKIDLNEVRDKDYGSEDDEDPSTSPSHRVASRRKRGKGKRK